MKIIKFNSEMVIVSLFIVVLGLCFIANAQAVVISSPTEKEYLKGYIEIIGNASAENFAGYELFYAPKEAPAQKTLISSSTTPVSNGLLGEWNTFATPDGVYILTLSVIDSNGVRWESSVEETIDNVDNPPAIKVSPYKGVVIQRGCVFKLEVENIDDPRTPWGRLTFFADNLPPHATFDPQTQTFSWQPTPSEMGTYEVTFTVRDARFISSQKVIFITLNCHEVMISSPPDIGAKSSLRVNGKRIVWCTAGHLLPNVYMYDVNAQELFQITNDTWTKDDVVISGDRLVWVVDPPYYLYQYPEIYMHDLSSGQTIHLLTSSEYYLGDLSMWGDMLIYRESPPTVGGSYHTYLYNIATGENRSINISSLGRPIISGNRIVYAAKIVLPPPDYADTEIHLYDIQTQTDRRLTNNPPDSEPFIHEDKVVYSHDGDIYLYDLITDEEKVISTRHGVSRKPAIYKDLIVYEDYSKPYNDSEIYLYDLSTELEFQITDAPYLQYAPAIWGDIVAWRDRRYLPLQYGDNDIYMTQLSFSPLITSITPLQVGIGPLLIQGAHFGNQQGSSQVVFENGAVCPIESWSDTRIICRAPQGAVSGLLSVVTSGGRSNAVIVDNTPPSTPVVTDEGRFTSKQNQLSAYWNSEDPEYGILEFKYKITEDIPVDSTGYSKGRVVRNWTSTGSTPSVTATGLSLQEGKNYYFGVKARNNVGLWSEIGISDGITVDSQPPTIVHTPLTYVPFYSDIVFNAAVTDTDSGLQDITVYWQRWVYQSGSWRWTELRALPMTQVGTDTYTVTLSASTTLGGKIKYYIKARDRMGNIAQTSQSTIVRIKR